MFPGILKYHVDCSQGGVSSRVNVEMSFVALQQVSPTADIAAWIEKVVAIHIP